MSSKYRHLIQIRLSTPEHRQVRNLAAAERTTVSDVVRKAVHAYAGQLVAESVMELSGHRSGHSQK